MKLLDRTIRSTSLHVCGIALLFLSLGMLLSALFSLFDERTDLKELLISALVVALFGFILRRGTTLGETDQASIFSAVGSTWLVVSLFGTLPYLLSGTFERAGIGSPEVFVDALFESVSGFSCTGSTVFGAHNLIELQGAGILFYRQLTQWIGGMGIVVLVVSVLPSLRASGLGLIDAEAPGAGVERIAPRVAETAKKFWTIYASITILIAVSLFFAGMGLFDAVAHAMTTASTGGFSTRDLSIGHWNSVSIEVVIMIGLLLGATNFTLHARFLDRRSSAYRQDSEFKSFIMLLMAGIFLITVLLAIEGEAISSALRAASFNVITLGSSGGFGNAVASGSAGDFVSWTASAQLVLLFFLIFGGCTGSTAGGVKIMRLRIGLAHTYRTLRSVRRPRALLQARMGSNTIPDTLVERVAGFVVVYGILVVIGTFILTALGSDLITSLSGVFSALGNMGPGLGEIGPTSSFVDGFSAPSRLILLIFMMIGRLEIFPMLLMFVLPYRASVETVKSKKLSSGSD